MAGPKVDSASEYEAPDSKRKAHGSGGKPKGKKPLGKKVKVTAKPSPSYPTRPRADIAPATKPKPEPTTRPRADIAHATKPKPEPTTRFSKPKPSKPLPEPKIDIPSPFDTVMGKPKSDKPGLFDLKPGPTPFEIAQRNMLKRRRALADYVKKHGKELDATHWKEYQGLRKRYESSFDRMAAEYDKIPKVKYAGRPTDKDIQRLGLSTPRWGDVRYDPGGGYVVYAKDRADLEKALKAREHPASSHTGGYDQPTITVAGKHLTDEQYKKYQAYLKLKNSKPFWRKSLEENLTDIAADVVKVSEFVTLGPDLGKWIRGEKDFNWEVALDLSFLPAMIFAAPLRGAKAGAVGAARGVGALVGRKGAKEAAEIAAKEASASYGKTLIQGTLARVPGDNAIARFIRNDPRTEDVIRVVTSDGDQIEVPLHWRVHKAKNAAGETVTARVPAAASRTGRLAERAFDGARPWLSKVGYEVDPAKYGVPGARFRVSLVKSPREKVAQAQEWQLKMGLEQAVAEANVLQRVASGPKLFFGLGKLSLPQHYALRMVGRGITPDLAMAQEREWMLQAKAVGDELTARLHEYHARMYAEAAPMVDVVGNKVVFGAKSNRQLRAVYDLLKSVSKESGRSREAILKNLGRLDEATMRNRIALDERIYRGAEYMEADAWASFKIREHPTWQDIEAFVRSRVNEEAYLFERENATEVIDAQLKVLEMQARHFNDIDLMRRKNTALRTRRAYEEFTPDPRMGEERAAEIEKNLAQTAQIAAEDAARGYDPEAYLKHMQQFFDGWPAGIRDAIAREAGWDDVDFMMDEGIAGKLADDLLNMGIPIPHELNDREALATSLRKVWKLAEDGDTIPDEIGRETSRDWYERAAAEVMHTYSLFMEEYGDIPRMKALTVSQVAQMYAILSNATHATINGGFVHKALRQYAQHGTVWTGRFPERLSREIDAVLAGVDWPGRKRSSFYANIIESLDREEYLKLGLQNPVTVDMHVVNMFDAGLRGTVPEHLYDFFEQAIIKMARVKGWEPKEFQASAWGAHRMNEAAKQRGPNLHLARKAGSYDAYEHSYKINLDKVRNIEVDPAITKEQWAHDTAVRHRSKAAVKNMEEYGGFTLNGDMTMHEANDGFYVADGLHEEQFPIGEFTWENVQAFYNTYRPMLEADPDLLIGGWVNNGVAYLDISHWVKGRKEAVALGRERGQIAVADIANGFEDVLTDLTARQRRTILNRLKKQAAEENDKQMNALLHASLDETSNPVRKRVFGAHFHGDFNSLPMEPGKSVVWISDADWMRTPLTTLGHEMMHYAHYHGIFTKNQMDKLKAGYRERRRRLIEEVDTVYNFNEYIAELWTAFVWNGPSAAAFLRVPEGQRAEAKEAMQTLSEYLKTEWAAHLQENPISRLGETLNTMVDNKLDPNIPRGVLDVFDELLAYEALKGGRWEGGWDGFMGGGELYLPDVGGLPKGFQVGKDRALQYQTAYNTFLFRPGQVSTLTSGDQALQKTFKGILIKSGRYHEDIIEGTVSAQMKAARMEHSAQIRERVLPFTTPKPQRPDDVAIRLDLNDTAGIPHTRARMMEELDYDDFRLADLENLGPDDFTTWLFPSFDPAQAEDVAALAERLLDQATEPIDNIVWVDRKHLFDMGVVEPQSGAKRFQGGLHAAEWAVDTVNDYMKLQLLLGHPAYYPMNMIGNLGMNIVNSGLMFPVTYARAARISSELGEKALLIDHFAGGGLMSVATLRGPLTKQITHGLQDVANMLVDLIPRRAEFINEARRVGFRNAKAIEELLTNPELSDVLAYVSQRTRWAMVDFSNLSQWEREVASRIIFVYPWIKGATYWAARLPKDHPGWTIALAALYAYQQDRADAALPGGRPTYLDLFMPVGTVERYGERYPYGFNLRQLVTAATPYEVGLNLYKAATGDPSGQALSEMLQPFYGNLLTQITGWDSFKHQEIARGVLPFLKSFSPTDAPWDPLESTCRHASLSIL